MIENVIVRNSKWIENDIKTLFGDEEVLMTDAQDIPSLMVELGIYKSKSESMRTNRSGPIPTGWTEFKASKKRWVWIWNPTE